MEKRIDKDWQTITINAQKKYNIWINMYGGKLINYWVLEKQDDLACIQKVFLIELKAIKILLAIKNYQLDNGELPQNLENLLGNYLDSIPIDEFDNTQMKYSLHAKTIFSSWNDRKRTKRSLVYDIKF